MGGLPCLGCLQLTAVVHWLVVAVHPKYRRAQICLLLELVTFEYVGILNGHHVGVTMLLMCFALLGAAASRAFRAPGLLALVSVLAIAIGVEGALSHRALTSVLLNAVLMLAAVEFSYLAATLLWDAKARSLAYWKV
ncbi:hypothetical protein [Methylobacterium sp. Leaf465]|uniref:hypothetical protein n=1 Tax=Methylobacterium sp. Leaf465 TaxID=1736385 RepID=UPI0012E371ED|nr:hypothetical protein [Methylobacterium sp. Leaf465]